MFGLAGRDECCGSLMLFLRSRCTAPGVQIFSHHQCLWSRALAGYWRRPRWLWCRNQSMQRKPTQMCWEPYIKSPYLPRNWTQVLLAVRCTAWCSTGLLCEYSVPFIVICLVLAYSSQWCTSDLTLCLMLSSTTNVQRILQIFSNKVNY